MNNREPINIFLISYHFDDVLLPIVLNIRKSATYPIRIIIGDNYSGNSNKIRKSISKMLDSGLIDVAYFYPENSKTRIVKHMFDKEAEAANSTHPEYTIFSDGDAYIYKTLNQCWLTDFIRLFKNDKNVGVIGFQTKNTSIKLARVGKKMEPGFIEPSEKTHRFRRYRPDSMEKLRPCPVRAHYLCTKSQYLIDYWKDIDRTDIYDGSYERYLSKRGLIIAKYIKGYTYNIGTIKAGFFIDNLQNKFKLDKSYNSLRHINWTECNEPVDYVRLTKK